MAGSDDILIERDVWSYICDNLSIRLVQEAGNFEWSDRTITVELRLEGALISEDTIDIPNGEVS